MWLLLQLSDGTFPSGGFAHSAGLEATLEIGALRDVEAFFDDAIVQAGRASLPFVRAAARDPSRLPELDEAFDATLPMEGPNRASRAQGRSLAGAAGRIFDGPEVLAVVAHAKTGAAHHAPVFGALFGALGVAEEDATAAYLHGAARTVLSAAVRLGVLGPLEAQRLHASRSAALSSALRASTEIDTTDVAQTTPLVEIWSALHHTLDARLFQS